MKKLSKSEHIVQYDHHDLPIFDVSIHVILTDNIILARKAAAAQKLMGPDTELDNDKGLDGLVETDDEGGFYLFLCLKTLDRGVLTHEVSHLTTGILKFRGVEDDEMRSLLIEYLNELLNRILDKKKIKVPKRDD